MKSDTRRGRPGILRRDYSDSHRNSLPPPRRLVRPGILTGSRTLNQVPIRQADQADDNNKYQYIPGEFRESECYMGTPTAILYYPSKQKGGILLDSRSLLLIRVITHDDGIYCIGFLVTMSLNQTENSDYHFRHCLDSQP